MFYIDVPYGHEYDWNLALSADAILQISLPAKNVKFICNKLAKISKGDLYMIELLDSDDEVTFYLRTGFKLIPENFVIADYKRRGREQ